MNHPLNKEEVMVEQFFFKIDFSNIINLLERHISANRTAIETLEEVYLSTLPEVNFPRKILEIKVMHL